MARLLTIAEAGAVLGVSRATIFRRMQRRELASVREGGRRLIPESALRRPRKRPSPAIPPFTLDNPIFRLVGAGNGGGAKPGAREKHEILDAPRRKP